MRHGSLVSAILLRAPGQSNNKRKKRQREGKCSWVKVICLFFFSFFVSRPQRQPEPSTVKEKDGGGEHRS